MSSKNICADSKKLLERQKEQIDNLSHQLSELRYLTEVVQNSNDAIIIQDLTGNIKAWNKGAQKMYGWPEAQAKRMNIRKIVPPEKADESYEFFENIQNGRDISPFETKRITADGRILDVLLTVTPLINQEGKPVAVATTERDITAQIQSVKEKIELIKQLQQTNAQLQKTLAETKTLRGIIPICMICKQIRDDKGFWEQVEVYVRKHSEADFSHGICPKCLQEKFPLVYQKKLLSAPKPNKKPV